MPSPASSDTGPPLAVPSVVLPASTSTCDPAPEFVDPTNTAIPTGNLGNIPFSTISAERTGVVDRPGNAAGVAATNTSGTDLLYTFVWHLEF